MTDDGTGLVALSYRGYGGSTGSPSEAGLIADAEAAYALCRRAHAAASASSCSANSLGSGVAVALAATHRIGGLVLEAPFTSAADIGAAAYWFLPVRLLMKDPFRSDERIGKVTAPLLVLHGARDGVVPIALGERLFSLANEPKRFVRFAEGAHNDLDRYGALDAVRPFLAPNPRLEAPWHAGAADIPPLSLRLPRRRRPRGRGTSAGCGHVGARRLGFRRGQESFLRRWVTPITASAALLALTTAFIWMIDAPLQHDHLIFIYLVPTALIAIRYGSISAMCVAIVSSIRRRLFPLCAALQLHGGEPARSAGTHFVQPAGAAGKPGGVRLRQRQRGREAAAAGARAWRGLARAMAAGGGAAGTGCAVRRRDQNV